MSSALVFSIEEFSVFDGPGMRTSVFLMGCLLRCEWCHNPEGQAFGNSIIKSPNGCIGCQNCMRYADREEGRTVFTEKSIKNCPRNLLRYCSKEYTSSELCENLSKNLSILNAAGGGITFSGGEPTASAEFLLECLSLLKGRVNRAVQTSGYCSSEIFSRVLDNCDYMLFDIKLVDEAEHIRYTGVSNAMILRNFQALAHSTVEYVIRTPLIPGVTDTVKNIEGIARLLNEYGIKYIELLPYNKMAGSKYQLAGMTYSPSFDEKAPVKTREEIFAGYGITSKII